MTARWAWIPAALLASGFGPGTMAQETVKEVSSPHRFFDSPVDFWGRGIKLPPLEVRREDKGRSSQPEARAASGDPGDWAFSVKLPNGQTSFQSMPERLVQVLEDPSPEKVQAYFEWRLKRTAKILRAAEAIKVYRQELLGLPAGEEGPPPAPDVSQAVLAPSETAARPPGSAGPSSTRLIYFHKKDCPHCDTQDEVLTQWLSRHPGIELETIEFGQRPELWQKHRVRGTPTIVVEGGATGHPVVLEGLADERRLDSAVAGPRSGPGTGESASKAKGGKP